MGVYASIGARGRIDARGMLIVRRLAARRAARNAEPGWPRHIGRNQPDSCSDHVDQDSFVQFLRS
jgi:hypothetical protein